MKWYPLLLLFFFFIPPKAQAVIAIVDSSHLVTGHEQLSKRQKRQLRRWEKRQAKWAKKLEKKERKNKYGRLGLLILLGGVLSLVLFDFLFLLALLGAMAMGILGIIEDEKKLAAYVALAIPAALLISVVVLFVAFAGE